MRPKTKQVKLNQGTFEPSRVNLDGVEFELLERNPSVPDGWPIPAQIVWRDVCSWLKSIGYLCKAYVPVIEEYSWAVYRCQLAKENLIKKPLDTHWEKVLDTNSKRIERLTVKLGFSPLDSFKIQPRKAQEEGEEDLFE